VSLQRGLQQACAPFRENDCDLVGILFRDEIIKASLHLQKRRIERPLGSIVWVKVKSCGGVRFTAGF
jgi:hypothetical protein